MLKRTYWINLFTAVTWEEFKKAGGIESGFRDSRAKSFYIVVYLTFFFFGTWNSTNAQTAYEVFPAVVYLHGEAPSRITGPQGEGNLWIQYDGAESPVQVMNLFTGSGFIVFASNRFCLVSAQHVINPMVTNMQVEFRGGEMTLAWFIHSQT